MKKIILIIFLSPFLVFAGETNSHWKIGLVELSGTGDNNTYGSVLIHSLKTSLEKSGLFQCRVYDKRAELFKIFDGKDEGNRESLIKLVPKSGEDFIISGDYQVENGEMYIILYAIDGAEQRIRMIKSYTGKTDIDIFDLIDKISGDFSRELQKNLPAPEPSVVVRYRKKLQLVSEKQKFPRLLTSTLFMEYQSVDSDHSDRQTAIQSIFLMQMQVERWLFSIRGPLVPLQINLNNSPESLSGQTGVPNYAQSSVLNVSFYISAGRLINKHWSLSLAPGIHLVGRSGSPFFELFPIIGFRPTDHLNLRLIPGALNISAILGKNYWVFAPFPLMLEMEWSLSTKLALFITVSGDYTASFSDAFYGWTAGLGLSYKVGVDF